MTATPPEGSVDLGHGHVYRLTQWAPDRDLNPQYADTPDIDPCGAIVYHPRPDGAGQCASHIYFDLPGIEAIAADRARWQLHSLEPLHVEPSLLCRACGDHGFIRAGRWEPA